MADLAALADSIIQVVGDRAEAEVSVTGGTSALTRFANSFIHQNVAEEVLGVELRVVVEGRVSRVSSTRVDQISELVERALAAARLRPQDPDWPGLASASAIPLTDHFDPATAQVDPNARAEIVRAFSAAGSGMRAAGYCGIEAITTAFANSAGQRLVARSTQATLDGIQQTPTSAGKGHHTSFRFSDLDGEKTGQRAAWQAEGCRNPGDLAPGRYPVVLGPECVATIVAFLSLYGFNAKQVIEGQSFAQVGMSQFDSSIQLWDDATDTRATGIGFDAEGTPKRRLSLVTNGVTSSLVHDRRTAKRMHSASTGHAIPGGESLGAFPSNLFLGEGRLSPEELLAAMDRGLLVSEFNYCRILDPKTQVVTGLTRNGTFLVERGEIVRPITNLRFTQSFAQSLSPGAVLGIGNDGRLADSEFGVGLAWVPSLRLAEWNFTGGAGG